MVGFLSQTLGLNAGGGCVRLGSVFACSLGLSMDSCGGGAAAMVFSVRSPRWAPV